MSYMPPVLLDCRCDATRRLSGGLDRKRACNAEAILRRLPGLSARSNIRIAVEKSVRRLPIELSSVHFLAQRHHE
jgi:hypothetical protein